MRSLQQRRAQDWARRTLTTIGEACRAVTAETLERMIDWVVDKLTVDHWSISDIKAVLIGKYLSCLRKLHHVIAPKEGFEAQLRAPRVPITGGMSALGMTRQIGDGHLQRVIEPCHVPGLQCLDNPA